MFIIIFNWYDVHGLRIYYYIVYSSCTLQSSLLLSPGLQIAAFFADSVKSLAVQEVIHSNTILFAPEVKLSVQ